MQNSFSQKMVLVVILLMLLGIVAYFVNGSDDMNPTPTAPPGEPVACTLDAKQCPDGSYVGRIPPNCEFAPCPDSNATDETNAMINGEGEAQTDQMQLQLSY